MKKQSINYEVLEHVRRIIHPDVKIMDVYLEGKWLVAVLDGGKEYKVHVTTSGLIRHGVEIIKDRVNELKSSQAFNPYELIGKQI